AWAGPGAGRPRSAGSPLTVLYALLKPLGWSGPLTVHEARIPDDQIPAGVGPGGSPPRPGGPAGVLVEVQPPRLHPAPPLRRPRPQGLPQDRLPRGGRRPRRLRRAAGRPRPDGRPALLDPLLRRAAAAQKGEFLALLVCATASAQDRGLIGER